MVNPYDSLTKTIRRIIKYEVSKLRKKSNQLAGREMIIDELIQEEEKPAQQVNVIEDCSVY